MAPDAILASPFSFFSDSAHKAQHARGDILLATVGIFFFLGGGGVVLRFRAD